MNHLASCCLILSFVVACDGVSSEPLAPDATSGPAVVTGNKRVFVTDTVYAGGLLGGLAGADMKCEARAAAAGLAGTYRAWLSNQTTAAAARLTRSTGAYLLVDGTMVATNWDVLTSGNLQRAINLDPFGAAYVAPTKCQVVGGLMAVWTGTSANGTIPSENLFCGGWDELDGGAIGNGLVGNAQASNNKWTASNCALSCTDEAALYCIEQ
ncbi:MAG: hypothetical protein M4D80_28375 [Myxococcota bacterium]|nr:hypothetical protein [Myxococcota bacterium]